MRRLAARKTLSIAAAGILVANSGARETLAGEPFDPFNVNVVAHWDEKPLSYQAADVWADDRGIAYVANRNGASIDIMDITVPSEPKLLTTYLIAAPNNQTNAKDVKAEGGLMFIGMDDDGNDGAQIVDVRDPANPVFLANVTVSGFADIHNLFYKDRFLYLVTSAPPPGLAVVDLRDFDPDNVESDLITEPLWVVSGIGDYFIHDVTVESGRAYLSAWDSGLWIYDVSNIANEPPQFIVSASGDNTHSAWPTRDGHWIVTNEERSNGGPVKLYEFSDSGGTPSLTHVFTFAIPTTWASSSHNVYVIGRRAYCAWYNRGMFAFDINEEFGILDWVADFDTSVETQDFLGAWGVYPFLGRDRVLVSDKDTQFWVLDVRVPGSGDFDGDADHDLRDFQGLLSCFDPGGAGLLRAECEVFDVDGDEDVDYDDFFTLGSELTTPS